MTMHIDVRVNDKVIGEVEIVNSTGLTDPKATNIYRWRYDGEGNRQLHGELTHRYGSGAIVLASKVIAEIALRYEIAATHTTKG